MSSNTESLYCSKCKRNLPNNLFIRNPIANTFFKTCQPCRDLQRARRNEIRRERSIPPPNPVLEQESINNGNISRLTPKWSDIFRLVTVSESLTVQIPRMITENIVPESNIISDDNRSSALCKGCKVIRPIDQFTDVNSGRRYRRCNGCRQRDYVRRNPGPVVDHEILRPLDISNGKINDLLLVQYW